jgi:ABC-type ATPase involved in cell division
MLKKLHVHGFRTLVETTVDFSPLTIMIGKNGAGKTSILDALQIMGNFARGGVERAFGPPPWSLGWQRTKGIGRIHAVRFEVEIEVGDTCYKYTLTLDEHDGRVRVEEERLFRQSDHTTIASFQFNNPPPTGSILSPKSTDPASTEIASVGSALKAVVSYELNPSEIEQGTDPEHDYVSRSGFGVSGFLAHLKDSAPDRFDALESRLKVFRPETDAIEVWSSSGKLFWGLRDKSQERAFPAVHMSWGDRQLVGLLCVLFHTKPGATIAIEEIDRGFHHSRYSQVIELLTEAAYDGLDGSPPIQVVITTHSPSFVNKLDDRTEEIRLVSRVPGGGTLVRKIRELLSEKLGTTELERPLGEAWEMGLLEDFIEEQMA